jgi:hypothetical protein
LALFFIFLQNKDYQKPTPKLQIHMLIGFLLWGYAQSMVTTELKAYFIVVLSL